jgi:hypothetical protein
MRTRPNPFGDNTSIAITTMNFNLRATTPNAVLNAAHIGFIDLDRSTEMIPPWPHHGRAQLLQDGPCCLIASQPQQALQAECADAMLLVGHVPGSGEPFLQRNRLRSKIVPAMTDTLRPQPEQTQRPSAVRQPFPCSHFGTAKPCWPPQPLKIRGTGLLIGKPGMKLLPRSRIRWINFR